MATTYPREPAYRVFSQELRNTAIKLEKDPNEKYAPQYVVTPTGAKVNRVLVVGTMTDIEDIGTTDEYWRVRIVDPTGTHMLYAGIYNPEATRALQHAEIPGILAVIGKVDMYEREDGGISVSIRPETVAVVDQNAADRWAYQTAVQTLVRIRVLAAQSPDAIDDMEQYRQMIQNVFSEVD